MGCISKDVILSFQTSRQYSEAINESNHVFLYCAFLDFRYCPCGRLLGRRGGGMGDGKRAEPHGGQVSRPVLHMGQPRS